MGGDIELSCMDQENVIAMHFKPGQEYLLKGISVLLSFREKIRTSQNLAEDMLNATMDHLKMA